MYELTLIAYIEAVALLVCVAVGAYFFSRMKEERRAKSKTAGDLRNLRTAVSEFGDREEKLRVTQKWYRTLFDNTGGMVFLHAVEKDGSPGTFIDANRFACERLGYTRKQLFSMTPFDIEDEESTSIRYSRSDLAVLSGAYRTKAEKNLVAGSMRNVIENVLRERVSSFEDVYRTRNGDKLPVEVTARRLDYAGKTFIMHTAHDAADRKKGERALIESERRLDNFFEHSPFGLALYDSGRNLVKVNSMCLKMFGIPDKDAFAGFRLFDNSFVPEDVKNRLLKGESGQYEAFIDFEECAGRGLFVTTRRGKGYFSVLINDMGHDANYGHRGFFAQVQDVTRRRKVEEDLRRLQVMPGEQDARSGISGSLEDMSFTDMMQILCAGGRSMEIVLIKGKDKGSVFIKDGDVVHRECGEVSGDDAFYRLMCWHEGDFNASQCDSFPERTVNNSLMSLLMEGARLADEG